MVYGGQCSLCLSIYLCNFRCLMQQCFVGPCQMCYMLQVMLLIDLQKAYGHCSQFTKIEYASISLSHFLHVIMSCLLAAQSVILHWACDVKQVGLVLDAAIEGELRLRHLQVADATRASLGLPVLEYIVTDTPLLVCVLISQQIKD